MPTPAAPAAPWSAELAMARRIDACRAFARDTEFADDVQLALILRDVEPSAVVRGTVALCKALPLPAARRWVGNFTKCVVLVGEPRKITKRFALARVDDGGGIAWSGPASAAHLESLRRLLRPLQTHGRPLLHDVTVALDPPPTEEAAALQWSPPVVLTLAVEEVSLEEYLVSLVHTVAEGALLGHFDGASALALHHVPTIDLLASNVSYARVQKGTSSDASLRISSTIRRPAP